MITKEYIEIHDNETLTIAEDISCTKLSIGNGAAIISDNGLVIMTVNHVQKEIVPGSYSGDILLAITEGTQVDIVDHGRNVHHTMPVAVSIFNGRYCSAASTPSTVMSGNVQDNVCEDLTVVSRGDHFGGIYVGGKGKYVINDAVFDLVGNGANDGFGYGAAIAVRDNAELEVNRARIHNVGSIRTALVVCGHGTAVVNDSVFYCKDGNRKNYVHAMSKAPWMLGITGRVRTTNAQDYATVTYNRCEITAENWGALSTDGTKAVQLTLNDCLVKTEKTGYGTYVMGNDCVTTFNGCRIETADYGAICCSGGTCVMQSGTTVESGKNGVMAHRGDAVVKIKDSSIHSKREPFFYKDAGGVLELEHVTLESDIGVLIRSIKDDDPNGRIAVMGPETVMDVPPGGFPKENETIPSSSGSPGGPGGPGGADGPGSSTKFGELNVYIKDCSLKGDILHASTAENMLRVEFANTKIEGSISSCTAHHINGMPDTQEQYREIGVVESVNCPNDDAYGVSVILKDSTTWIVTETSYLRELVISEDSAVLGATLLISGKPQKIEAGTYKGQIELKV